MHSMAGAENDNVQVTLVEVRRREIDFDHPTAGKEIAEAFDALVHPQGGRGPPRPRRPYRPPLAPEQVELRLAGVPTAVANGLRRALTDEIRGRCLTFDHADFDRKGTTERFMDFNFVRTRVRMVPLRPQIPEELVQGLRLALRAENPTDGVLTVYSGDLLVVAGGPLAAPLFNPTHELAFLQPGRTLRIENIRLAEGYGRHDAAFTVGHRAVTRPLDLEEAPRGATHTAAGEARELSGYAESSLTANPRQHLLQVDFAAVPPGGQASLMVVVDACAELQRRLHRVRVVVEGARAAAAAGGDEGEGRRPADAYFLTTPSEGGRVKGVLGVRGETDTMGNLLARLVYELQPDVAFAHYTCTEHENMMKLVVVLAGGDGEDAGALVLRAVRRAQGIYGQIQRSVKAALGPGRR
jgi:DNA-directed RNA polymerase subunit L